MIQKFNISDKAICECLKTDYNIEVETLTPLHIGADLNASLYKAHPRNHSPLFIKVKHGHALDVSIEIFNLLHSFGIKNIIYTLKTRQNTHHISTEKFTLTVYPFIDADNGFHQTLSQQQWIELGHTLQQIHRLKIPPHLQKILQKESYSPVWRNKLHSLYSLVELPPTGDTLSIKMHTSMHQHKRTILQLIDNATQCAKTLQKNPPTPVLCHSDIHAGNTLIDKKSHLYIVDWDEPILAPKERDLMFIGGGVGNVWNNPAEETYFYKGYGSVKVDKTALAYYRCERIIEDIAIYGHELLLNFHGNKDQYDMYNYFMAMFEPQGVIDIALKTYETHKL